MHFITRRDLVAIAAKLPAGMKEAADSCLCKHPHLSTLLQYLENESKMFLTPYGQTLLREKRNMNRRTLWQELWWVKRLSRGCHQAMLEIIPMPGQFHRVKQVCRKKRCTACIAVAMITIPAHVKGSGNLELLIV